MDDKDWKRYVISLTKEQSEFIIIFHPSNNSFERLIYQVLVKMQSNRHFQAALVKV